MTLILQVSWDLDGKYELYEMKVTKALAVFGLKPGNAGAGFSRRDMEFEYTKTLTEQEEQLLRLDLDSFKSLWGLPSHGAIPGFEWVEPYDDEDLDDPFMGVEGD